MTRRPTSMVLLVSAATSAALIALVAFAPSARACGGFFTEKSSSEVAVISDIRVLLVQRGQQIDQYVQVGYSGGSRNLAWIYPVASNPQIEEVEEDIFAKLEQATRPQITIATPHGGGGGGGGIGFGCGGATDAAGGAPSQQVDPKVKVWQRGQVGSFDYVVLSANVAADLLTWLGDNGFAVPGSTATVAQHYLDRRWLFVAMKLSVTAVASDVPSTTIIHLGYKADELRYPLRMVSLSAAPKTSIELYLLTDERGRELSPDLPFSTRAIDQPSLKASSPTEHNYEAVFRDTLAAAGQRGFVVEYSAADWSPWEAGIPGKVGLTRGTLTRLRGELGSAELDRDIVFVPRDHSPVSNTHYLVYQDNQQAGAPLGLLLLVLGWQLARRIRRRHA